MIVVFLELMYLHVGFLLILFSVVCVESAFYVPTISASNYSSFLKSLDTKYDKILRPNFNGEPVIVTVNMLLASVGKFNEVDGTYYLSLYLRARWKDERLKFYSERNQGFITLSSAIISKLWAPDTYILNEDQSRVHDVMYRNQLVYLWPDGRVLLSTRVTIRATCILDLINFPMDRQSCSLSLSSYGYSDLDISYRWFSDDYKNNVIMEPSAFASNPSFYLLKTETSARLDVYPGVGNFTVLTVTFDMKRRLGYFVIHIYIPSSLLVIISWVSFWISQDQTAARVGLGITTALALTTIVNGVQSSLPKVNYVKAIDWFLVLCFVSVFASLLEYAFVHFFKEAGSPKRKFSHTIRGVFNRGDRHKKCNGVNEIADEEAQLDDIITKANIERRKTLHEKLSKKISTVDKYARVLFPLSFLILNAIYWATYASAY